jgi:hypothetical protein
VSVRIALLIAAVALVGAWIAFVSYVLRHVDDLDGALEPLEDLPRRVPWRI